jgi:ABC-type antimicrobial peptide transport system permease subunit
MAQRRQEIGVRIALGAQRQDVIRLVMSDGVLVGGASVLIGVALALVAGRWIAPLLLSTSPRDPLVFGLVTVTLMVVAVAASMVPALRAARVDPTTALRGD